VSYGPPTSSSDALIGREAEFQAIGGFLKAIPLGSRALLFSGDLGIGKTALWEAALARAASSDFRVLASRPSEAESRLSFSVLADLFGSELSAGVPELPLVQREALESALFLADSEGSEPNELAVSLGVLGVLRALAGIGPLVIGIDDLQWVDPPSGRALEYALRRLDREPIGVIATIRGKGPPNLPLRLERAMSGDRLRFLEVRSLSERDLGALLRDRMQTRLSRSEVGELHRMSGGNPFFAIEIAGAVDRGEGMGDGDKFPIPESLREAVRDHLRALPGEVKDVLVAAAALSVPTPDLLATAMDSSDTVDRALAIASEASVIGVDDEQIRFVHPFLGSVLLAELTPESTRDLHRRLANIVTDPEERARHLALGADGPDAIVAGALEDAARSVSGRGASSAAADLAEMAHRLTPADSAGDRTRRGIAAAEYHFEAGDPARAAALLETLLPELASGPARGAALQRLGWIRYHEDGWAIAESLFEEASADAADDARITAALDLDRSTAALLSGDLPRAAALSREALDKVEALGNQGLIGDALAVAGSVAFLSGEGVPDEQMGRAVGVETWSRPRPTAAHPSVAYGLLLKWSDDLDGARKRLESACERTRDQGNERSLPFLLFHLAELECWAGNWDTAERRAAEADEIAVATAQESSRAFTLYARALVDVLRGRVEPAREATSEGLGIAERTGASPVAILHLSLLGSLELALGDTGSAARYLGPLADATIRSGIREPGVLRYLGDVLDTLISVGDLERATNVLEPLEESSKRVGRVWGLAVSARCRGQLESATGDQPRALRSLDEALEHQGRLAQPFELGRTMLAKGIIQRRDRQKAGARTTLEQALGLFQELGAPLWVERTTAELGRIGGRAPSSLDFTATERRVAELVAGGSTNQEVAATLFMSVKTVEWNLSRIYRKAGVRSRTELASWLSAGRSPRTP
jgi:DNA-binding CsgD family transcriptional regulator